MIGRFEFWSQGGGRRVRGECASSRPSPPPFGLLSLAMFSAVGAMFELGASLSRIDRMHARAHVRSVGVQTEMVDTYDLDPATPEPGVRFHMMQVRRR